MGVIKIQLLKLLVVVSKYSETVVPYPDAGLYVSGELSSHFKSIFVNRSCFSMSLQSVHNRFFFFFK